MAPSTISQEVEVSIPAPRLWAAMKDSQLVAKALKPMVTEVEDVKGGGGSPAVGDIRVVHFNTEIIPVPFSKEELTVLDESTLSIGSKVLEGGFVGNILTSQSAVVSLKPKGNGTVASWTLTYESAEENPNLEQVIESFVNSFKGIEAYLTASNEYN